MVKFIAPRSKLLNVVIGVSASNVDTDQLGVKSAVANKSALLWTLTNQYLSLGCPEIQDTCHDVLINL
jgi:ethanolamine transporter EutH